MLKDILKKIKPLRVIYSKFMAYRNLKHMKHNLNTNGKTVFSEFIQICCNNCIKVCLCYGTLLGYIRENGIMKHDYDFDVGLWFEDYTKEFEDELKIKGFKLIHQFTGMNGYQAFEQSYEKNGVSIDLFYHFSDEKQIWTHVFHREPDTDLPQDKWLVRKLPFTRAEFKKIDFMGIEAYVPSNSEQYLEETYGKNWRVPDKNFDWKKGPQKDSLLPGVLGKAEFF